MRHTKRDSTKISFGKLSDPGVMEKTPLANTAPELRLFTTGNFQYIVDNIVDMFGLKKGTVQASVVEKDHVLGWLDRNENGRVDDDELMLRFTMNAAIDTYRRDSFYGKHYMYAMAKEYGYPVIFGIVAHEVGHLVNRYTMCKVETRYINQSPYLVETQRLNDRWDELCADYLAGIVLAKTVPRLNQEPMKKCLSGTQADEAHPDGFWRVFAVEMGYQWGCANPSALTSRVLSDRDNLRQLLISFFETYYQKVYCGVDARTRRQHSDLSRYMLENCSDPLAKL